MRELNDLNVASDRILKDSRHFESGDFELLKWVAGVSNVADALTKIHITLQKVQNHSIASESFSMKLEAWYKLHSCECKIQILWVRVVCVRTSFKIVQGMSYASSETAIPFSRKKPIRLRAIEWNWLGQRTQTRMGIGMGIGAWAGKCEGRWVMRACAHVIGHKLWNPMSGVYENRWKVKECKRMERRQTEAGVAQ